MSKGSFRHGKGKVVSSLLAITLVSSSMVGSTVSKSAVQADETDVLRMDLIEVVLNDVGSTSLTEVRTEDTVDTYERASTSLVTQISNIHSEIQRSVELEEAKLKEQQRIAEEKAEAIRLEEERIRIEAEKARLAAEEAERKRQEEEQRRLAAEAVGDNVPNWMSGCRSNFKAYMGYKAVTCTSSPQYKLLNGESAYTDSATGIRMVDDRYCIAVGSYYSTTVGQKIDLYLETGVVIPCIVGDCKANCHTNSSTHQYCLSNGSVAEFIVDYTVFNLLKDGSGTVNWCVGECGSFDGKINKVVLVD